MIVREIKILFTAIMFYTRLPVPKWTGYSKQQLNSATRYFPLIGIIVGGIAALVFMGAIQIFSQKVSVLFGIAAAVLLTGAFHEDAFADFCDGFGGGYTPDKIRVIMKDSRIGTYGTVGLILLLLSKFILLNEVSIKTVPVLLVSAHVFSRMVPVFLIFTAKYVGNIDDNKAKPVGEKSSFITLIIAIAIGLIPTIWFFEFKLIVAFVIVQVPIFIYFRYYILKHLEGYTGDVLGALQQISEVAFYVTFITCSFLWV